MMDGNKTSWSFAHIWNESIEKGRPEREVKPRANIWASELGGSHIDRYLKMRGVTPTNPPNARSLRKFEAGNMMEWLVGLVLKRAGILRENQTWLSYTYPNLCEVTGKLDYFAGGLPNWLEAQEAIRSMELPEFFNRATEAIIDHFGTTYPEGLSEIVLEIKSCSSFMFDYYERFGPNINHSLQAYHYIKAKNLPEAHVVYICKDDLRMLEFGIHQTDEIEDLYKSDIAVMTNYLKKNIQPELEPEVIFDSVGGRFTKNWKVEYSNYLTKLYGFETPDDYRRKWDSKVAQFNRVLKRCATDAKMTPLNLQIIEEIKTIFPNFDELVVIAKSNIDLLVEEELGGE